MIKQITTGIQQQPNSQVPSEGSLSLKSSFSVIGKILKVNKRKTADEIVPARIHKAKI